MANRDRLQIDVLRRRILAVSGAGAGTVGFGDLLGSLTLALTAIENATAQTGPASFTANTPETLRIFKGQEQLAGFVYCQMIERIFGFWKLNNACIDEIRCERPGMHEDDIRDSVNRFCDSNKYNERLIRDLHELLIDEYGKHSEYGDRTDISSLAHDIDNFVLRIVLSEIRSYNPDQYTCVIA